MTEVYLLLGSNLDEREQNITRATEYIISGGCKLERQSSLYETAPWGLKEQGSFINKAIALETGLAPVPLLDTLKKIEKQMGRTNTVQWGPRIIDIDILFYGNETIQLPQLTIPHPFISQRRFTLEPLNEIAPGFIHPVLKKTISELLHECPDNGVVKKL